jgi:hypothetical protein
MLSPSDGRTCIDGAFPAAGKCVMLSRQAARWCWRVIMAHAAIVLADGDGVVAVAADGRPDRAARAQDRLPAAVDPIPSGCRIARAAIACR